MTQVRYFGFVKAEEPWTGNQFKWSREPNRKGVSTMKTKSYKATFFRHNPQFKNGGYVTERKIEAVSLPSARKRAREISEHCVYGSMELLDVEMEA